MLKAQVKAQIMCLEGYTVTAGSGRTARQLWEGRGCDGYFRFGESPWGCPFCHEMGECFGQGQGELGKCSQFVFFLQQDLVNKCLDYVRSGFPQKRTGTTPIKVRGCKPPDAWLVTVLHRNMRTSHTHVRNLQTKPKDKLIQLPDAPTKDRQPKPAPGAMLDGVSA